MQIQVDDIKEDEYLYANLVRNRKLPIHISELTRDQQLVDSLKEAVGAKETAAGEGACGNLIEASNTYKTDDPPEYSQLLQDALDAGLAIFNPAVEKDSIPFDEEYFNGLIARTAKVAEMTEEDLKAPVEESAATTAGPTVLIADLAAMLAAASA
ncbi:hypothetical protein EBH_0045880 [Eimeria brunetti]|uniref:Uncharacterized protein n=1 Tax=Eimeria brunetti TaxID=51314 RepID=U6M2I2_9EIME|nr:hypothetical protein EBH_0045880 [Eimeria brunetti]